MKQHVWRSPLSHLKSRYKRIATEAQPSPSFSKTGPLLPCPGAKPCPANGSPCYRSPQPIGALVAAWWWRSVVGWEACLAQLMCTDYADHNNSQAGTLTLLPHCTIPPTWYLLLLAQDSSKCLVCHDHDPMSADTSCYESWGQVNNLQC